jgi:hypothetical protein
MEKLESLGYRVRLIENDGNERNLLSLFRKKIKLTENGFEHSFDDLEDSEEIYEFLNTEKLKEKGFKLPATVALVEYFKDPNINFYGNEENTLTSTVKRKFIEA